jgi:DNA-binding PadR family transcriptional regulator
MEKGGLFSCEARTVNRKQRKYYRITMAGGSVLNEMKHKIIELYKEIVSQQ